MSNDDMNEIIKQKAILDLICNFMKYSHAVEMPNKFRFDFSYFKPVFFLKSRDCSNSIANAMQLLQSCTQSPRNRQ